MSKAKSFRPFWGNPGEEEQTTCKHRFGSREECEKYAAKRMQEARVSACGSVESADPVNAKLSEDGEVEAILDALADQAKEEARAEQGGE